MAGGGPKDIKSPIRSSRLGSNAQENECRVEALGPQAQAESSGQHSWKLRPTALRSHDDRQGEKSSNRQRSTRLDTDAQAEEPRRETLGPRADARSYGRHPQQPTRCTQNKRRKIYEGGEDARGNRCSHQEEEENSTVHPTQEHHHYSK